MRMNFKKTNFFTTSLITLVLLSSTNLSHSSNRYDDPYEIDRTDEFDEFFSFFDGTNTIFLFNSREDSSSFAPSYDESFEETLKRKRDFEKEEIQEENEAEEESVKDLNDTLFKRIKAVHEEWELSPTLTGMQKDVRGLIEI